MVTLQEPLPWSLVDQTDDHFEQGNVSSDRQLEGQCHGAAGVAEGEHVTIT